MAPRAARAWDANLVVSAAANQQSRTLRYDWNAAPASCSGGTFHHYAICVLPGGTAPDAPDDPGTLCTTVYTRTTTNTNHAVNFANRLFTGRIFACTSADCATWYGYGDTCTVSTDDGGATTYRECYVTIGVDDEDDPDRVISDEGDPALGINAASTVRYPAGWDSQGKVGIWWSWVDGDGISHISWKRTTSPSWPNFNLGPWETGTAAPSLDVALSVDVVDDPYSVVTHPWVMLEDDGAEHRIRLFLQTWGLGVEEGKIAWMPSLDEDGTDFDLTCAGSCSGCGYGDPCDYTGVDEVIDHTAYGLRGSHHGVGMWDILAYGPVDFSVDDPLLAFTGLPSEDCNTALGVSEYAGEEVADIYVAFWDHTDPGWAILTETVGGLGECPLTDFADQHDPAQFYLPDEYKLYNKCLDKEIRIYYGDEDGWTRAQNVNEQDCSSDDYHTYDAGDIVVCFDTGPDACTPTGVDVYGNCVEITSDCIDDVNHLFSGGTTPKEGIFFGISATGPACTQGYDSLDAPGGIVYAERKN